MNHQIIISNEADTNRIMAKILPFLSIPLIIFDVMVWMKLFGDRFNPWTMTIPFAILIFIFFVPYTLYKLKITGGWIKYFNMSVVTAVFAVFYYMATGDAPIFFPFPVVISAIYFNKRLTLYTFCVSMPVFAILNFIRSQNPLLDPWSTKIIIISIYFVFIYQLVKKCYNLLTTLVDADKEKVLLTKVSQLLENSQKVSIDLNDSVSNLLKLTEETKSFNEQTANSADYIVSGTKTALTNSEAASTSLMEIINNIKELESFVRNMANISTDVSGIILKNDKHFKSTMEQMQKLSTINQESNVAAKKLNEILKQVSEIVTAITDISEQTNLLSLNAAIEAARSGEHGRGFAVVADEIGKLSVQTTVATKNITSLIKEIEVTSDNSYRVTNQSFIIINESVQKFVEIDKSFVEIVDMQKLMADKINESVLQIETVSKKSSNASAAMEDITSITSEAVNSLANIASFTRSLLDLNNKVLDQVKQITDTARLLVVENPE